MFIGSSQIDISPKPGAELAGFAARIQPSIGLLDPLFAKAVYLLNGAEKLLWIHCDLLECDREIVLTFRRWASEKLGLRGDQVTLSATHTHSGPCTVRLKEAGAYDAPYVEFLHARLREAAQKAIAKMEKSELVTVEGILGLARDRRDTATSHTDPRVAGVGFRRPNGSFITVIVNYPIHPVALGASNRCISADIPGQAALALSRQLPGNPIVMLTNDACANLNPPAENVSFDQIKAWGERIANAIAPLLKEAPPLAITELRTRSRVIPLPLDSLTVDAIHLVADRALQYPKPIAEWGDTYRRAVHSWRTSLVAAAKEGNARDYCDAELFGVSLGSVIFISLNGEVFSQFTDWLRKDTARKIYVVGYTNGALGYLPTLAAYAEGGYEVEVAHFFQGHFRTKAGGLEFLAEEAIQLVRELTKPMNGQTPTVAMSQTMFIK